MVINFIITNRLNIHFRDHTNEIWCLNGSKSTVFLMTRPDKDILRIQVTPNTTNTVVFIGTDLPKGVQWLHRMNQYFFSIEMVVVGLLPGKIFWSCLTCSQSWRMIRQFRVFNKKNKKRHNYGLCVCRTMQGRNILFKSS